MAHSTRARLLGAVSLLFVLISLAWAARPVASAARPTQVTPTTPWVNFYSPTTTFRGQPVPVGAVIAAFDSQGTQCGEFVVTSEGAYGLLPCYADDPTTVGVDEGAEPGDAIRFTIDGLPVSPQAPTWSAHGDRRQVNLASPTLTVTLQAVFDPLCISWHQSYSLRVGNASPTLPQTGVALTSTLPTRTYFLPERSTPGASYDPATRQVSWLVGALAAGQSKAYHLEIGTNSSLLPGTVITTTASAASTEAGPAATSASTTMIDCTTRTPTTTATATHTPVPTATPTSTPVPTATATASATPTPRPSATPTPSPTATAIGTATATPTATATATATDTATPTATPPASHLYVPVIVRGNH